MVSDSVQSAIGFPDGETLRAIAETAIELANVIEKSVVTDAIVGSIREADANDLPVMLVLSKLEALLYAEPPGFAKVAEKWASKNILWMTREWPAGWLEHYAVKQSARHLWRTIAGLLVYFGGEPLSLGTWDKIDGKFVRRVMQHVEHPPLRSEVIGPDGRIRQTDEGLSTSWLGSLRQYAQELLNELKRAAMPADWRERVLGMVPKWQKREPWLSLFRHARERYEQWHKSMQSVEADRHAFNAEQHQQIVAAELAELSHLASLIRPHLPSLWRSFPEFDLLNPLVIIEQPISVSPLMQYMRDLEAAVREQVIAASRTPAKSDGRVAKPRDDEPTEADLLVGRQVLDEMATRNPAVDRFRAAVRAKGLKGSNAKLGKLLAQLKSEKKTEK